MFGQDLVPHLEHMFATPMTFKTARLWIRGTYVVLTTYYTIWTLAAFWLLSTGYLHPCFARSVHLMLVTSSLGGLYATYIYPQKLVLRNIFPVDIVLEGWLLRVGDLISHHVPLALSIAQQNHDRTQSKVPYLLGLAFYLAGHDPRTQYGMDDQDIVAIFIVVAILFFFL